jgi:hypothetical protein
LSAAGGDFAETAIGAALPSTTMSKYEHHTYKAFAMIEPPYALVDWPTHSHLTCNKDDKVKPIAFSASCTPLKTCVIRLSF